MGATCSTNWKDDFSVIKDDDPREPILLQHHHTNQQFQLISIPLADQRQIDQFKSALKKRENFESANVQRLHTVYHKEGNEYCGNNEQYDLVFQAQTVTLDALYKYRQQQHHPFSHQQIEYIIRQVCLGLKDLKNIQEQHGNVTMKTILVNKSVKLRDPTAILAHNNQSSGRMSSRRVRGYPSPQKLYQQYDSLSSFQEFTSDLYSVGLVALQLYHLDTNIKGDVYMGGHPHYYNNRINQQNLQMLWFMVEKEPLKDWIKTLINQEPNKRLNIFEKIEAYKVDERELRELRGSPLGRKLEQQLVEPIKTYEQMRPNLSNGMHPLHQAHSHPREPTMLTKNVSPNYGWRGPQPSVSQSQSLQQIREILPTTNYLPRSPEVQLQQQTAMQQPPSFLLPHPFPTSSTIHSPYSAHPAPMISQTHLFPLPKFDLNHPSNLFQPSNSPLNTQKTILYPSAAHPQSQSLHHRSPSVTSQPTKEDNSEDVVRPIEMPPLYSFSQSQDSRNQDLGLNLPKITSPTEPEPPRKRLLDQHLRPSSVPSPITELSEKSSHVDEGQFVIQQYEIGTRYEGFKRNGKRNGLGKFYYSEGSCYDGEWKDNKMDGYGVLTYPNGAKAYEGYWRDDEFEGTGTIFNDSQVPLNEPFDFTDFSKLEDYWISYEGEIHEGKKHGIGKILLTNGESYSGRFSNDEVEGEGIFTRSNGAKVKGQWVQSRLQRTFS